MITTRFWMYNQRICLDHFEHDKAMGGDMYARFAACYSKNTGNSISSHREKLGQHVKVLTAENPVTAVMPKVKQDC